MKLIGVNSHQYASKVYEETQAFLERNPPLASEVNEHLHAHKILLDLIPQEVQKLFSGHLFPFFEAEWEIENAILISSLGFYKLGFTSLRGVLELSMLTVYFDRNGEADKAIQGWLKSREDTPFFSSIRKELFAHGNFEKVQSSYDLRSELDSLYYTLCDYTHTKGGKYSNRRLGNGFSNFNVFNEKSFRTFLNTFKAVIRINVALHLIKYPVGLLETPIFEKFGFNRILGTFIEPGESDLLRRIVGVPLIDLLQKNAESNGEALSLARYINELPNLTEQQLEEQSIKMHKSDIENEGWNHWINNLGNMYLSEKEDDTQEYKGKKAALKQSLYQWAVDNNFLESKMDLILKKKK